MFWSHDGRDVGPNHRTDTSPALWECYLPVSEQEGVFMVRGMGFRLGTCRWPRRKGMFVSLHLGDLALIRCSEGTWLQLPGG